MAKRRRSGDTAKGRRWRELVGRWQQSGQTVREFCRTAEVKESAFSWWKRRLARPRVRGGEDRRAEAGVPPKRPAEVRTGPAGPVGPQAARFLPVRVVRDRASQGNSGVELRWDNGWGIDLASVKRQKRYALAAR